MALNLKVITPDKTVWDDTVEEIVLPSTTGQLGILAGHAPLITALDIGVMRVRAAKEWSNIALTGGFAEVDNDEIKVLVNGAAMGKNIDKEAAREEYERAQTNVRELDSSEDRAAKLQANRALKRARARFQAAGGMT